MELECKVLLRPFVLKAYCLVIQYVQVIREVYAPGLGLWLSDYPFIDKSAFLDVSLQVSLVSHNGGALINRLFACMCIIEMKYDGS